MSSNMGQPGDKYPIIPLPYDTVPVPGRRIQISSNNRQDVVAIIANFYNGAFNNITKENAAFMGCIPLRSPYLGPDGQKLIESGKKDDKAFPPPDPSRVKREQLFNYGGLAKIQGVEGGRTGEIKLVLECTTRFKLGTITQEKPYLEAKCQLIKDEVDVWDPAVKGAFAHLKELSRELFQIIRMSGLISRSSNLPPMLARQLEVFVARKDISEAGVLADFMANLSQNSFEDKLRILAAAPIVKRIQLANELLQKQISTLQASTRIVTITNNSQEPIDQERLKQMQRESLLRQKNGLPGLPGMPPGSPNNGQGEDEGNEIDELKKRLDDAQLSPEAEKAATRELKRLQKMNPAQAEYQVIRNYLENLAEIPWTKVTDDKLDASTLSRARKQLDDDHYGLEKIKKRLLEYLAVLRLKQRANEAIDTQIQNIVDEQNRKVVRRHPGESDTESEPESQPPPNPELEALRNKRMIDKSPILLLVGPPGTGKTSLAKSVATSLGRKFHRISLGGVRDEAEIRGHRRTYVAAMPGLIVSGLKKVGVANPVFLLDEIDKVGTSNFHGDPSAAMLEVLDPEQNHSFNDHYVNIPIDLSKVLFIATANTLDTIPPPLLDRMETIQLSGYTTLEKRHIATRHLIPKQITTNGLEDGDIQLPEDVIDKIITAYTRESGVRNLEREIGSVCRYKAVEYSDSKDTAMSSTSTTSSAISTSENVAPSSEPPKYNPLVHIDDLDKILGIERFEEEVTSHNTPRPGVVTGLVAFSTGGQGSILFIEIAEMPGSGSVQLTGKLGAVLKESVEVALTWVKAHAYALGIATEANEEIMKNRSIHVHCPAGAVPKDGPSAGLAHTVALVSLFSGKSVSPTIAMTGEVSLRGKVTPVGGIKEKLIGALRAGVKTVLLPIGNRKDVRDLPAEVTDGLEIVFVETIWEGLSKVWPNDAWASRLWHVESRL